MFDRFVIVAAWSAFTACLLVGPCGGTADAVSCADEFPLQAADNAASDEFGVSIAVSGSTAVVGAWRDSRPGLTQAGAACVFVRGASWIEQAKLVATDAESFDMFGTDVALDGDTILVGAPHADLTGVAYVFVRNPGSPVWTQQAKLVALDGDTGDGFGWSVDLRSNTAIIGAPGDDDAGDVAGAAYIFVRDPGTGAWSQQQKLLASDGATRHQFGFAVTVHGGVAVAGAPYEGPAEEGAAYVFVQNPLGTAWSQEAKLVASDRGSTDWFGYTTSLSSTTVLIGAPRHSLVAPLGGSAYVFVRGPSPPIWSQQTLLTPSDSHFGQSFGWDVAVDGQRAIIGAHMDGYPDPLGAAYVYERTCTTWTEVDKLTASDGALEDNFGVAVGIDSTVAVVGAHFADDAGIDSGKAYAYGCTSRPMLTCSAGPDVTGPCNGVTVDGSATSLGCDAPLFHWTSACPDTVFLPSADVADPTVYLSPCGVTCELTLAVTQAGIPPCVDSTLVTVTDSTPPDVVLSGAQPKSVCFWPPNHKYIGFFNLGALFMASDDCGAVSLGYSCDSDQCDDAPPDPVDPPEDCLPEEHPGENGDGNTVDDCWWDALAGTLWVRSERAGTEEEGRTYTISVVATDSCGNGTSLPILTVWVPHDQSDGGDRDCLSPNHDPLIDGSTL